MTVVNDADRNLTQDVGYTPADFRRIADFLKRATGIKMPDSNDALVYSRLAKRVRAQKLNCFSDYVDLIGQSAHADECEAMISALTTNTTRFFRESYHFDTFVTDMLPDIVTRAEQGERVRLWSAGCSSGEEPFTLAAVLLKHFPEVAKYDVKILATDINRDVLACGERGVYRTNPSQPIAPDYAAFMFDPRPDDPDTLAVRDDLKSLVTFRYMNFVDPWPVRGPFATIFCRNVMIYMDEATQMRVWAGLADVLCPGGYLFIGHSERIGPDLHHRLKLVSQTTFQRI